MQGEVVVVEEAVGRLARLLNPMAFERSAVGLGHQEFEEEDREAREGARAIARDFLVPFADSIRSQERQRVRATFEKRIAYLRSEAKSGRELADQSVDPEDARKYRIRAGSYEWAADGFEHDLAALSLEDDDANA